MLNLFQHLSFYVCVLIIRPLIAAEATSFVLIQKEAKNQDKKILPRTWPLPFGPGFLSGLYPRSIPCTFHCRWL